MLGCVPGLMPQVAVCKQRDVAKAEGVMCWAVSPACRAMCWAVSPACPRGPRLLRPQRDKYAQPIEIPGAGDGNRTHDIQLGKLTFYL